MSPDRLAHCCVALALVAMLAVSLCLPQWQAQPGAMDRATTIGAGPGAAAATCPVGLADGTAWQPTPAAMITALAVGDGSDEDCLPASSTLIFDDHPETARELAHPPRLALGRMLLPERAGLPVRRHSDDPFRPPIL